MEKDYLTCACPVIVRQLVTTSTGAEVSTMSIVAIVLTVMFITQLIVAFIKICKCETLTLLTQDFTTF